LLIKTLDPDWIRIGIKPKMLGADPDSMNPDPKHKKDKHDERAENVSRTGGVEDVKAGQEE